MVRRHAPYRIEYIYRPGLTWSDSRLGYLISRLCECALTCFDRLPDYQIMLGTREEMRDKILAVAWRPDGKMAGFCSTVLLEVEDVGQVVHLGLTCVRPDERGGRLTHHLTTKVLTQYLLRKSPLKRVWISNCACVLSSLGNVSLHFDSVHPSPFFTRPPTPTHLRIARAINESYREKMYVMPDACFDETAFVFRGSVKETVFQKVADDPRYQHRVRNLNRFYSELLNFDQGDEALQIGYVSLLTCLKYQFRKRRFNAETRMLQPSMDYGM